MKKLFIIFLFLGSVAYGQQSVLGGSTKIDTVRALNALLLDSGSKLILNNLTSWNDSSLKALVFGGGRLYLMSYWPGGGGGGGGGTTTNPITFNNSGSGAASGTTFNGASAVTISYNSIGAAASNATISGVALGGNLNALTNGRGITGAGTYNGSTARTFGLDTSQAYTWTANQTITGTGLTGFLVSGSSGGGVQIGNYNSSYGLLWSKAVTASTNNYALLLGATTTQLNVASGGTLSLNIADGSKLAMNTTAFYPVTNNGMALGTTSFEYSNVYTGGLIMKGISTAVSPSYVLTKQTDSSTSEITIANLAAAMNVVSGTYTPTITLGTNVTACTATGAFYQNVGGKYTVTIWGTLTTTTSATQSLVTFSLPSTATSGANINVAGQLASALALVNNTTATTIQVASTPTGSGSGIFSVIITYY